MEGPLSEVPLALYSKKSPRPFTKRWCVVDPLPDPCVYVQFLMGSVLLCVGDISELIEGTSASIFLFYLLVIVGLIIMRFTHAEEPRLFKVSSQNLQTLRRSCTHTLLVATPGMYVCTYPILLVQKRCETDPLPKQTVFH